MDFLLPHAAVDDLMSAVQPVDVSGARSGYGVFEERRRLLQTKDETSIRADVLQTDLPWASPAPSRLRTKQRSMPSTSAGCLAGVLVGTVKQGML